MQLHGAVYVLTVLLASAPLSVSRKPRRHLHLTRHFRCDFTQISRPDDFFAPGTTENAAARQEIQEQLDEFMSGNIDRLLSVAVHRVTPGNLVADVTVVVDWTLNRNAGGELSKALLDLGHHGVVVNGTASTENTVVYNNVTLVGGALRMSACDVRQVVQPCDEHYQVCETDDGVPVCEDREMRAVNKFVLIGSISGALFLIMLIARQVWMRRIQSPEVYQEFTSKA